MIRRSVQRVWARTGFGRSTFARSEFAASGWAPSGWVRGRTKVTRSRPWWWAAAGALLGAFGATAAFAPAAWLAAGLERASGQRVLLADANGSIWRGSGVLVLTGGPGSRDASALPGRLHWRLGLELSGGVGLVLHARQACCINGELGLRIRPGIGRVRVELPAPERAGAVLGQWPAAWLAGLGTPWNTLQPQGLLLLSSPGFTFEQAQGRASFTGQAVLELTGFASRLSTLESLGSYRLQMLGSGSEAPVRLQLSTTQGALQLSGTGTLAGGGAQGGGAGLRFSGQASAAPGFEPVLANLLNIIGRRQGALSVISIG